MRRMTMRLALVAAIVALAVMPLAAKKPTTSTPKAPKTTVSKTSAPKSPKASAQKTTKATAPKSPKASAPKSAKATSPKGSSKKTSTTTASTSTGSTSTTSTDTSTSSGSTTTSDAPVYTNGVAKKLSSKPNHLAKLEAALGISAGTMTTQQLNDATSGFKNFGQLNAAVNASQNHPNVEFADLKALMTGLDINGDPVVGQTTTYSLGQALKQLGVEDADSTVGSGSTTTTSTTSTAAKKTKKKTNATSPSGGTE